MLALAESFRDKDPARASSRSFSATRRSQRQRLAYLRGRHGRWRWGEQCRPSRGGICLNCTVPPPAIPGRCSHSAQGCLPCLDGANAPAAGIRDIHSCARIKARHPCCRSALSLAQPRSETQLALLLGAGASRASPTFIIASPIRLLMKSCFRKAQNNGPAYSSGTIASAPAACGRMSSCAVSQPATTLPPGNRSHSLSTIAKHLTKGPTTMFGGGKACHATLFVITVTDGP